MTFSFKFGEGEKYPDPVDCEIGQTAGPSASWFNPEPTWGSGTAPVEEPEEPEAQAVPQGDLQPVVEQPPVQQEVVMTQPTEQQPVVEQPPVQQEAAMIQPAVVQPAAQLAVATGANPLGNYSKASKIHLEALVRRGYVRAGDVWVYSHDFPGQGEVRAEAVVVSITGGSLGFGLVGSQEANYLGRLVNPSDFAVEAFNRQGVALGLTNTNRRSLPGRPWEEIQVTRGQHQQTLAELREEAWRNEGGGA